MRNIWGFSRAVVEEWKGWITGSLPMAVIAAVALIRPEIAPFPGWAWALLIFVAGYTCAVFRVWRMEHKIHTQLQKQLDDLGSGRPFRYDNLEIRMTPLNNQRAHFTISLIFENRGELGIRYRLQSADVKINGIQGPVGNTPYNNGRYLHPHEKATHHLPTVCDVPINMFPSYIDVEFVASYDNDPSVKERSSMRKIKYMYSGSFVENPISWVIEEREI